MAEAQAGRIAAGRPRLPATPALASLAPSHKPATRRPTSTREELMDRRSFVIGSAAAALIRPAVAQDGYPNHAVTIISPFPPGGATEIITRPLAAVLEPIFKQPVVID